MRFLRIYGVLLFFLLVTACSRNAEYYLTKGTHAAATGNDADAVLNFLKVLQIDPQSGSAHLQLGLAYQRQSKLREARDEIEKAVEIQPNSAQAKVSLADVSLAIYLADPTHPQKIYDEISHLSDELLANDAQSFDGQRLKGDLALLNKQMGQAIDWLQKANRIKPMQSSVVLPLAESLFGDNRPAEAEDLTLKLIERDKTVSRAYDTLYLFYTTHNRVADAEKILERKVANNPNVAAPRLQLAEHYTRLGKDREAAGALQPLLENSKIFPDGRLQAADFYYSAGKVDQAIQLYQSGVKTGGDKLVYQKRLVEVLTRQGKRDQAAEIVTSALQEHPADDELKTSKAVLLADSGKPENISAALPIFAELVKANPQDPARHLNLGRTELLNSDLDHAQTELAAALRLAPQSVVARALLADVSLRHQDFASALRYSGEVLAVEPGNRAARMVRSASLLGLGRYKELRQELDRAPAAQTKSVDALFESGSLSLAEDRPKDAEEAFRKSFEANPGDAQSFQGIVEAEIAQKQSDKALRSINDQLSKSPDSAALRGLLAATALRTGNADLAIEQYKQLIAKSPKAAGLYFGLGESFNAKGDFTDALAQFEKARQIAPGNSTFQSAVADTENLMGRRDAARESFRRALVLQPEDPTIMNNLAYLIAETGGSLQEALKFAEAAVRKQPRQLAFLDTLGWIYLKAGQIDSALQVFNNLTEQDPHNPLYQYHLAASLFQKGERAKAKETLTTALAAKPPGNVASEMRQLLAKLN